MIGFICVMHKCSKCSRNSFDIINNFINSLYEHCTKDFILYLFDNGSDEKYLIPNYTNIRYTYIKNQDERGLYVLNDGISNAIDDGCDIIILVNDDVVFNKTINDFVDIIKDHEYKDVGLYGPLTNGILFRTYQKSSRPRKGTIEITNEPKPYGILNGFLLCFTKEFYEKFKFPDGTICKARGEDKWRGGERILINRIKPEGGRVFIIKDCWVFHHKFRGWKK